MSPRDVSYQPTERELKFIERLTDLEIDQISRAEAECVIRRSLTGFAVAPLKDQKTLQNEAKQFGIDLKPL